MFRLPGSQLFPLVLCCLVQWACEASSQAPEPDARADLGFAGDGPVLPRDSGPCTDPTVTQPLPVSSGISVVVETSKVKHTLSPVMLGANINQWFNNANGLWDATTQTPVTDAVAKAVEAGLGLLRFPGGTCANLFDWKRAVGPHAERGCQTDAKNMVARDEKDYGVAEFMQLVQAAGAQPQIMVPFANESPEDAADWVEYMNAKVGTNPNGGVAWAEVRQADGFTAPFNVTRWEIGNEHDRGGHQTYWMTKSGGASPTPGDAQRLDQYIDGAELSFVDQPMGRGCDFTKTTTSSQPNQTFYFLYGLIKPGTFPAVKVGGTTWTRVADLSTAQPTDTVYRLDRADASITFGDGNHGAVPPAGQEVTASYTFKHEGFVAMYDAMKAVAAQTGTPISVCAAWAPVARRDTALSVLGEPSFPAAMKGRKLEDHYDCVAMHPYTNFGRDFGTPWTTAVQGHHDHMLGDTWARKMVQDLVDEVDANSTQAFVTISEQGALWFTSTASTDSAPLPQYSATMTHALYMASQWIHFARRNVRWVEGNTLVANAKSLRGVLGGSQTGFVYGAEAMARQALKPVFAQGSIWIGSRVDNPVQVTAPGGETWPALVVGASLGADGALRIVVVNRRPNSTQVARVDPRGFTFRSTMEVTVVQGTSFSSYNDGQPGGGDDSVSITHSTEQLITTRFDHTFPAASVTVLTLWPPCS